MSQRRKPARDPHNRELTARGPERITGPVESVTPRPEALSERLDLADLPADIRETPKDISVICELPDVSKRDLSVRVAERSVVVSGQWRRELGKQATARGYFKRVVALPAAVKPAEAVATFKDRVLRVRIPKTPGGEARRIEVQ